jgi:16S rRNA (guanine966-N2)-methyltransferase
MRILAGSLKGKWLYGSNNFELRPTTARVKESIFYILRDLIQESEVVDLFCGSGNLGLEALSQGAFSVTFVEKSLASIALLTKNLDHLAITRSRYSIVQQDVFAYCNKTNDSFDLILADPPFKYEPLPQLVHTIATRNVLRNRGILVIEHEITNPLEFKSPDYVIIQQKKFGRSLVSYIMRTKNGHKN